MSPVQEVEFKTLGGVVLRGSLYLAKSKGPAVAMAPGFNMPVSLLYHEVAKVFCEAGITVLVYDNRSIGRSDGMPRSDINPARQTEDYSDAVTFLKTSPLSVAAVDPRRIGLWGYSMSGACALAAAALDPRVKFVIAVCPAPLPYDLGRPEKRAKYLELGVRDREAQAARGREPYYVEYIGDSEDTALFDYHTQHGLEDLTYDEVLANLAEIAPDFRNEVTVQTLRSLAAWPFSDVPRQIGSKTPVMQIFAEHEELDHIREAQEHIWSGLEGCKKRHLELGQGHFGILTPDGDRFNNLVQMQVDFALEHVGVGN